MSSSAASTVGLLLAAGGSRRLGEAKQLLPWQGRSLIVHALEQMLSAGCSKVVVVLGSRDEECRACCQASEFLKAKSASLIYETNLDWEHGQASSLRVGLQTIRDWLPSVSTFLVALCDQPLMTSQHYQELISAVDRQSVRVAAVRYPEGPGVPACFRVEALDQLLSLQGDAGAKSWIRGLPPDQVARLDFGDLIIDIDTPEIAQTLCGHCVVT